MPRTFDYEGTAGTTVTAASEGADLASGTISYVSGGRVGSTAGRFGGGVSWLESSVDSATVLGWSGWMRRTGTVDANRLLVSVFAGATAQASISILTTGVIRIRNQTGTNVGEYATALPVDTWWGMEWLVNRSGAAVDGLATANQRLRIYGPTGTLLTTLTGACGTTAFTVMREGILAGGAGSWTVDYDQTKIAGSSVALEVPTVGATGAFEFVEWNGTTATVLSPIEWNGTTASTLELTEKA